MDRMWYFHTYARWWWQRPAIDTLQIKTPSDPQPILGYMIRWLLCLRWLLLKTDINHTKPHIDHTNKTANTNALTPIVNSFMTVIKAASAENTTPNTPKAMCKLLLKTGHDKNVHETKQQHRLVMNINNFKWNQIAAFNTDETKQGKLLGQTSTVLNNKKEAL